MKKFVLFTIFIFLFTSCIEDLGVNQLEDESLVLITVTDIILSDTPGTKDIRVEFRINSEYLNNSQVGAIQTVIIFKNGIERFEFKASRGFFIDTNLPSWQETCYEIMPLINSTDQHERSAFFCIE